MCVCVCVSACVCVCGVCVCLSVFPFVRLFSPALFEPGRGRRRCCRHCCRRCLVVGLRRFSLGGFIHGVWPWFFPVILASLRFVILRSGRRRAQLALIRLGHLHFHAWLSRAGYHLKCSNGFVFAFVGRGCARSRWSGLHPQGSFVFPWMSRPSLGYIVFCLSVSSSFVFLLSLALCRGSLACVACRSARLVSVVLPSVSFSVNCTVLVWPVEAKAMYSPQGLQFLERAASKRLE